MLVSNKLCSSNKAIFQTILIYRERKKKDIKLENKRAKYQKHCFDQLTLTCLCNSRESMLPNVGVCSLHLTTTKTYPTQQKEH